MAKKTDYALNIGIKRAMLLLSDTHCGSMAGLMPEKYTTARGNILKANKGQMKERPILFSTPMVLAILESRKTMTRRVMKHQSLLNHHEKTCGYPIEYFSGAWGCKACGAFHCNDYLGDPYGQPGDCLWVRETFCDPSPHGEAWYFLYKADMPMHWDESETGGSVDLKAEDYKWKPSIFMPRDASRILLEIVSVRVEKLQDISEEDAIYEGMVPQYDQNSVLEKDATELFKELWDSINEKRGAGWYVNPWVWVIEFKKVKEQSR